MTRSRGALSQTGVDRSWPHQVVLPVDLRTGKNFQPVHGFCLGLSMYSLRGQARDGDVAYDIFRFKDPEDALEFKNAFGGIPFYPEDCKGRNWKRPPGDVRRPPKIDPYRWPRANAR